MLLTLVAGAVQGVRFLRTRLAERARLASLRNGSPAAATALAYEETLLFLKRKGWGRQPWMTPAEYQLHLQREWPDHPQLLSPLSALTESFQRAQYAGDETAENLERARTAAAELRRLTPARPRPPRAGRAVPAKASA
jgi:hypothetical protein